MVGKNEEGFGNFSNSFFFVALPNLTRDAKTNLN